MDNIQKSLNQLTSSALRLIRQVGQVAQKCELESYLVGGIVRDVLLKRSGLDLDIVIVGPAVDVAKVMAKQWNADICVYEAFQTATVTLKNGYTIDFATARREVYLSPGSLPRVQKGMLEDDLLRRDFTINALAVCIDPSSFGSLADASHGYKDLKAKRIRILHDKSFLDDPTRILRAIRFEQRLGFRMHPQTLLLLKKALRLKYEKNVKSPRYFNEFIKMLKEDRPVDALKRLKSLKADNFLGLKQSWPTRRLKLIEKNVRSQKKSSTSEDDWFLYVMALIENEKEKSAKTFVEKFQFHREHKKVLLKVKETKGLLKKLSYRKMSSSQVYQILHLLSGSMIKYLYFCSMHSVTKRRISYFLKTSQFVSLKITGSDLCESSGVEGKKVGEVMKRLLLAKRDKKIKTKSQELRLAKKFAVQT